MNKYFTALVVGLIVLVTIGMIVAYNRIRPSQETTKTPAPTETKSSTASPSPLENATSSSQPVMVSQVKVYLIAIGDEGKSGQKIGCGDSVISVTRNIAPTAAPLKASIEELLSLKDRNYGQSGLYNALYQSNLTLESATLEHGTATVLLKGNLRLGGVCDNPRVEAQLTQTALQFPTVKQVHFLINDVPLKDALSLK